MLKINKFILFFRYSLKNEEVAKIKIVDLNTQDILKAMKIIEGTAKNMGISIEG